MSTTNQTPYKPPTTPGWYWMRQKSGVSRWRVFEVNRNRHTGDLEIMLGRDLIPVTSHFFEQTGTEWRGPLKEPEP